MDEFTIGNYLRAKSYTKAHDIYQIVNMLNNMTDLKFSFTIYEIDSCKIYDGSINFHISIPSNEIIKRFDIITEEEIDLLKLECL